MSEPAAAAAVGIETVQCSAESGGQLTIRVTGRWRRPRPITGGQPTLVIETDGRRDRYPAMSEPPSLSGNGPGVWRLRFTVPERLAPDLERTWLQFGSVIVPLPIAGPAGGAGQLVAHEAVMQPREPTDGGPPVAPLVLAGADDAGPGGLESRVAELERELDQSRAERAEQAAAAVHASERADGLIDALHRELDSRARADGTLRARAIDAETRLAARVLLEQRTTAALAQVRTELGTLRDALQRERGLRREAERRAAALEREPAPSTADPSVPDASAPDPTVPDPIVPDPIVPDPSAAPLEPERLSDALTRLRATIAPQAPPASANGDDPSAHPPLSGGSVARADRPLEPVFRRLVRRDPDAAGRLLLELLPLAALVHPRPVAYDLVLRRGPGVTRPCVWVTVLGGAPTIRVRPAPRPADQVDFQVVGEPVRIARLLVAGWLRRRLGLGVARVRGSRAQLPALGALLSAPLDLTELHREGVRLDSATTFALVAAMVDPAWTAGRRFTIAHEEPQAGTTYVSAGGGRRIEVTPTPPAQPVSTTLRCRADQLSAALCRESVGGLTVSGDPLPLAWLRQWINRAQSA